MTISEIIRELAVNKEVVITGSPQPQYDAKEPRFHISIHGPERILKALEDAIWWAGDEDNAKNNVQSEATSRSSDG